MDDLDLRPERRARLASSILDVLSRSVGGSSAELRGSLATGRADEYSDIDVLWAVPDDAFSDAVAQAGSVLDAVAPVVSIRADPDLQRSDKRRVLFIRFQGIPIFWRLDLEVRAHSVAAFSGYDDDNPGARGDDWSRPTSAAANALAVVKCVARGDLGVAAGLLERGYERIGVPYAAADAWIRAAVDLATRAADLEPGLRPFVAEICEVALAVEAKLGSRQSSHSSRPSRPVSESGPGG